jgi:hypothetical protein
MKHFIQASATVFINPLGPDFETLHGQVEACSVPAAISRDENYVKEVVECGGLRPLAVLCDSPFGAVHEKAVVALFRSCLKMVSFVSSVWRHRRFASL